MTLRIFAFIMILLVSFACQTKQEGNYVCKPCDLPCDELRFEKPGKCPHCNMVLEKQLVLNEIAIAEGAGAFLIEGGTGKEDKSVKVYYYKPKSFDPNAKVLLVIPGAGRNADSYRDTWIDIAEKHKVLILAPQYAEKDYGFGNYHLGGLVQGLNLAGGITFVENTNIAKLDEQAVKFEFNSNVNNWIFNDFDRIFDVAKAHLNLTATRYDLFGHSAGGHILHRMALFHDSEKANRMIAANASFYTLPTFEQGFPFGLKNTSLAEQQLMVSFSKRLIVLLGEQDNENETRGTFLRSTTADKQGLHRLARGTYFFETAKAKAKALNTDFNWQLSLVPNVGHDQQNMGQAAARLLYNN